MENAVDVLMGVERVQADAYALGSSLYRRAEDGTGVYSMGLQPRRDTPRCVVSRCEKTLNRPVSASALHTAALHAKVTYQVKEMHGLGTPEDLTKFLAK